MTMDLSGLTKIKVAQFDKIKARLNDIEAEKQQLLQEGLELQGAIKQLSELLQVQQQESISSATETK